MKLVPSLISFIFFVGLVVGKGTIPNYNQGGYLWPQPASIMQTSNTFLVDPLHFWFDAPVQNSILQRAFSRYQRLFFPVPPPRVVDIEAPLVISNLRVVVTEAAETDQIQFGTDESYSLQVNSQYGAVLTSITVFGALRGLETFSQLLVRNGSQYYVNETTIVDSPRYPWRGLLIDTSRHWLPVRTILEVIEGCAYSKINTLHWHIVDGQSFPLESKIYPLLSGAGSYFPNQMYTQDEVREIVTFANDHGVRIVPEFDMPAHASSWGFGYPFMVVSCSQRQNDYDFNDGWGDWPMDPTNPNVYTFIQNFLTEMSRIFPDNWLHLGGDEVPYHCWNTSAINQYMKVNGIKTYADLETLFISNVNKWIKGNLNKNLAYWQEVFQNTSPFIGNAVDVWIDAPTLLKVLQSGLNAIRSYGWYLDYLDDDWATFYQEDPVPSGATPAQAALILGGEGSMWGETVDETNIHQKVWTRFSAIAERLWSPKTVTDIDNAVMRLSHHRCRYVSRGIPAQPFQPGPGCYTPNN